LLKPVYAFLRKKGYSNIPYIDDSLLKAKTYHSCEQNVLETINIMDNLGFTINPEKSVFKPSHLNSENMTVK
jgi:hypothetical protein